MAITFPRELPEGIAFQGVRFDLTRYIAQNALSGGRTDVLDLAEPRWTSDFTTKPLRRREAQMVRAWFDSLRGGLKDFLAYDTRRCRPVEYAAGYAGLVKAGTAVAFGGTADVTAVSGHALTLAELPANFRLKAGDLVGLTQSGKYAVHEIMEDTTASSGGVVTLNVEPAILTIFTAAATANFEKPKALMVVDPNSWSHDPSTGLAPVSFSAIQRLY